MTSEWGREGTAGKRALVVVGRRDREGEQGGLFSSSSENSGKCKKGKGVITDSLSAQREEGGRLVALFHKEQW